LNIYFYIKCLEEDLEALMASQAFRIKKQKMRLQANKLRTANTMNYLKSIKKQLHKRSEKPLERKHSRCTQTKEEILKNSNNCLTPIKFSQIQRRDSCMMIMDNKESKMEDHQEGQDSEDYLIF
jgi:hypothetical protein